jgi:FlaA1/EpsC-like NDP-sugar epimerase
MVVRFGNVLGSRGSILPLFSKQIAKGGPVTLTHPEARRFFMTIPEAVSLVLQAGGVGKPQSLYLLDMGDPVLIRELAEQMITLHGYKPGIDIPIVYTGLRPGEKLEERLWAQGDSVRPAEFPKLLLLDRRYALNGRLNAVLDSLRPICFFREDAPKAYRNRRMLRETLKRIIPDLRLPEDEPPH